MNTHSTYASLIEEADDFRQSMTETAQHDISAAVRDLRKHAGRGVTIAYLRLMIAEVERDRPPPVVDMAFLQGLVQAQSFLDEAASNASGMLHYRSVASRVGIARAAIDTAACLKIQG